jgi:hypothetical protein
MINLVIKAFDWIAQKHYTIYHDIGFPNVLAWVSLKRSLSKCVSGASKLEFRQWQIQHRPPPPPFDFFKNIFLYVHYMYLKHTHTHTHFLLVLVRTRQLLGASPGLTEGFQGSLKTPWILLRPPPAPVLTFLDPPLLYSFAVHIHVYLVCNTSTSLEIPINVQFPERPFDSAANNYEYITLHMDFNFPIELSYYVPSLWIEVKFQFKNYLWYCSLYL